MEQINENKPNTTNPEPVQNDTHDDASVNTTPINKNKHFEELSPEQINDIASETRAEKTKRQTK